MTGFLISTIMVAVFFVALSIRSMVTLTRRLIDKAAIASLSLFLAIACAAVAIYDKAPEQLGFVAVFLAIHIGAVISYTASQILARIDSRSSPEATDTAPNKRP